jgi:hypothetical protein
MSCFNDDGLAKALILDLKVKAHSTRYLMKAGPETLFMFNKIIDLALKAERMPLLKW